LRRSKETDKIELMSFINASRIKKNQFKKELKGNEETKKLQRLLPMKIRMHLS